MKKLVLFLLSLTFIIIGFSQENRKELTDAQKDALRKNHSSTLNFSTKNKLTTRNVNSTGSTEQSEKDVKTTTTVKYYYGKKDSLFKKFEYKNP